MIDSARVIEQKLEENEGFEVININENKSSPVKDENNDQNKTKPSKTTGIFNLFSNYLMSGGEEAKDLEEVNLKTKQDLPEEVKFDDEPEEINYPPIVKDDLNEHEKSFQEINQAALDVDSEEVLDQEHADVNSDEEDEVFNVNTLDDLPNYEDHAIDFTSEEANFLTDIRKPEIIHVSDMGAINEMLDYDVNTESNLTGRMANYLDLSYQDRYRNLEMMKSKTEINKTPNESCMLI